MLEDLYDAVSLLWSWRWPSVEGEVTAVDVERLNRQRRGDTLRLAVAYKFSIGNDGPYTGESFWVPAFFVRKRVIPARHRFSIHQRILVRYRPDNPSVNVLDRQVWKHL